MKAHSALFWGCFHAFVAIAAGAFGAHELKETLSPEMLDVFKTGAHYQLIHGVALFSLATLGVTRADFYSPKAALSFCVGSSLFAFSLYALALTDIKPLGAITPFGGLLFLVGWVITARTVRIAAKNL